MIEHIKVLYRHRDLLLMWTLREIKVRYKQSILGGAWAILQPLVLMLTFSVVFSTFVRLPSGDIPYPLFSYTALLAWTFTATSITFAVPSLVNNLNLVTKVYFPREILPLASIGAAFVDMVIASLVFLALLIWYQVPVSWAMLWLPLLLTVQVMLNLGVVLPAAAINVFYRDIRFVIPLGVQLWLYASPVIYPIDMVPQSLRSLYALNPMVGVLDSYRKVVLLGEMPAPEYLVTSALISLALVTCGYAYFKHAEDAFADLI